MPSPLCKKLKSKHIFVFHTLSHFCLLFAGDCNFCGHLWISDSYEKKQIFRKSLPTTVLSYRILLYSIVLYCIVLYGIASCRIVSYHNISYRTSKKTKACKSVFNDLLLKQPLQLTTQKKKPN